MSEETVRLRLDIGYDGTGFFGWATQPGLRTVQSEVETALTTVLRIDEARLTCAGRTDAGVHARGQVAHVDVPGAALEGVAAGGAGEPLAALRRRLANLLAADVRVHGVAAAAPGFDARHSAIWRRYAYRVCDDPAALDPLRRHEVLARGRRLDVDSMNTAAVALLGEHDFAAFCKRRDGASTVRTLRELSWVRGGNLVTARVVADAFCRSMVRALVGAMVAVGEGQLVPRDVAAILAGRQRDPRLTVMGPQGLTLEEVGYPDATDLAAQAIRVRRVRTLSS